MSQMTIAYPTANSQIPPTFTAWGYYTVEDGPNNGTCTLTNIQNNQTIVVSIQFRSDGVWTASFMNVPLGTYHVDAYYIVPSTGQQVHAPRQTPVTVAADGVVVAPPPPASPPAPPPPAPPGGERAATPKGVMLYGSYPASLQVQRLLVILSQVKTSHQVAVVSGLATGGTWTVILTPPAAGGELYLAELLFLDAKDEVVIASAVQIRL